MNRTELVAAIAEKTDLTQKVTEKILAAILATVKETVACGDKVQLIGFGTFEARKRNARTGKNPATGEAINIPETIVPAFKAGKSFKDIVNAAGQAKNKKKAKK